MVDVDAFYSDGQRALQDRFDTRRLADRLTEISVFDHVTAPFEKMIARLPFFWLATADEDGWPDVSYKGGAPGFVRVSDEGRTISFPSYDGNGMYRSMGNISANPKVGLLFIDFERPKRLRIKGIATLDDDASTLAQWPGAELVVRVTAHKVFFNCPRYVHRLTVTELSEFAPREGHEPPEPEWKELPELKPYLPGSQRIDVESP